MTDTKEHQAYGDFESMHEALGAEGYKVQVRDPDPKNGFAGTVGTGKGYSFQTNSKGKQIPIIPPEHVVQELLTNERKVVGPEKWSPMARPVSSTKTYLLIDDLDHHGLTDIKAYGFSPAYVQETSPNSIQAVLISSG